MKIAPKVKLSNDMILAADVMRDELLRQIELLTNDRSLSKKNDRNLDRLAKMVSDYEDSRDVYCFSQVKIAKPSVDVTPEMQAKIAKAVKKALDCAPDLRLRK